MKIAEKILIFVFLLGMLFKMQHYPGGGLFVVISLFSLSLIYLISGLQSSDLNNPELDSLDAEYLVKEKDVKKSLVSNFPIGIYLSISLIGFLFKTQHYPGQSILFTLSMGMLFFVIAYTYVRNRGKYLSVLADNGVRIFAVLAVMVSSYWDMISYYLF